MDKNTTIQELVEEFFGKGTEILEIGNKTSPLECGDESSIPIKIKRNFGVNCIETTSITFGDNFPFEEE